jgi:hypothetical protein
MRDVSARAIVNGVSRGSSSGDIIIAALTSTPTTKTAARAAGPKA